MISERSFATSFPGFWVGLLPLLTPSFVHVVNDGFKESVTDKYGVPLEPVPKNPQSQDPSVVSEFAFFLAKIAVEEKAKVEQVIRRKTYLEQAERSALNVIAKYEGVKEYHRTALGEPEIQEAFALARNYQQFFRIRAQGQSIEFGPEIPGAGFLSVCKADISIGNALFEVKTVDRNLSGKDIRQLIVYLALQAATGKRRWLRAGFFNPRKAVYFEFGVDEIVERMSGRSSSEVFQELIDFVCTRDVQVEVAF